VKGGKMFRKKGFTLLELIIVIIVIGILASIALPRYLRVAERGRMSEGRNLLGVLRSAQIREEAEVGAFAAAEGDLDVTYTLPRYFTVAVANNAAALATVTRNTVDRGNFDYSMSIDDNGTITCTNGGAYPACVELGL
jgi:prepilin-type N-terminal cleavage/methylation domain-containing protein